MNNEKEAQKAKAKKLRKQIQELVEPNSGDAGTESRRRAPRVKPISPREFIHRKMNELDNSADK